MAPETFSFINTRSLRKSQRAPKSFQAEAEHLHDELRTRIEGEVRFDEGSRALYATDASNYRQVPIGVVIPRHVEDVVQTVAACRREGVPVLCRGAGTSLAGQSCNVAVIIDMSKYLYNILEIDPSGRLARVQPGVILDVLRNEAEAHHLTFAPDPSTHDHRGGPHSMDRNSWMLSEIFCGIFPSTKGAEDGKAHSTKSLSGV